MVLRLKDTVGDLVTLTRGTKIQTNQATVMLMGEGNVTKINNEDEHKSS